MEFADQRLDTSFDLVLPPDAELLRVVRLVASGLASYTKLSLDGVEAVRVAADELVSALIQAASTGRVTVSFSIDTECIEIRATTELGRGTTFEVDPLTDRILAEVCTSHGFEVDGDRVVGTIRHELPPAA